MCWNMEDQDLYVIVNLLLTQFYLIYIILLSNFTHVLLSCFFFKGIQAWKKKFCAVGALNTSHILVWVMWVRSSAVWPDSWHNVLGLFQESGEISRPMRSCHSSFSHSSPHFHNMPGLFAVPFLKYICKLL